jgi:hypothetical protein
MVDETKPLVLYKLLLTEEDKFALLNIVNTTTFKGQDALYVSSLIDRITQAPPEPNKAPSSEGGQPK